MEGSVGGSRQLLDPEGSATNDDAELYSRPCCCQGLCMCCVGVIATILVKPGKVLLDNIDAVLLIGLTLGTMLIEKYLVIEDLNGKESSQTKDNVKNGSALASSYVNAVCIAAALILLLKSLHKTKPGISGTIRDLNCSQRAFCSISTTLSIATAALSMVYFGAEQNIIWAAALAAASITLTRVTGIALSFFSQPQDGRSLNDDPGQQQQYRNLV